MNDIKVLHLIGDFGGSSVHKNLTMALDQLGVKQIVFVPLNARNRLRVGNHNIEFKVASSEIIYSTILKGYHRFFYRHKIATAVRDVCRKVDLSGIDVIHASTFCMDGAIAFELSKQFGIPFIAAVRNTDVNTYYKWLLWEHRYFDKILLKASQIVFISPPYKAYFLTSIMKPILSKKVQNKAITIPNGINPYFLNHRNVTPKQIQTVVRVMYAGAFNRGKQLIELIEAIRQLRDSGYQIQFTAIGKGLPFRRENRALLKTLNEIAHKETWITLSESMNHEQLKVEFAKNDIFVMPSLHETFGLVYVEALTQGLPIVYTRGQGFDGFYPDGEVGYAVDAIDVTDIARGIEQVIQNYPAITERIVKLPLEEQFNWDNIAKRYLEIYKEILN